MILGRRGPLQTRPMLGVGVGTQQGAVSATLQSRSLAEQSSPGAPGSHVLHVTPEVIPPGLRGLSLRKPHRRQSWAQPTAWKVQLILKPLSECLRLCYPVGVPLVVAGRWYRPQCRWPTRRGTRPSVPRNMKPWSLRTAQTMVLHWSVHHQTGQRSC